MRENMRSVLFKKLRINYGKMALAVRWFKWKLSSREKINLLFYSRSMLCHKIGQTLLF